MKRMLSTTQYVFSVGGNLIDFSTYPDFQPSRLLAVINTSINQTLIFSTGGGPSSPTGGTFYGSLGAYYLSLTFNCGAVGMSDSDTLQIIYDESVGTEEAKASIDIVSGKSGLDVNLLNSSFGGTLDDVMPAPFQDNALSIAVLNGGVLSAPAMNVNNELIVDVTQSGSVPVAVSNTVSVDLNTYGGGNAIAPSSPLPATPFNPATGGSAAFGPGAVTPDTLRITIPSDQTQIPTYLKDLVVTGSAVSSAVSNLLTGGAASTNVANYINATVQIITTAAASGGFQFESSLDNVNFKNINMTDTTGVSASGFIGVSGASTKIYTGVIQGNYFRISSPTGFGAGTATAFAKFSCNSTNALLASLDAKLPVIGSQPIVASMPVNIASDQVVSIKTPDLFITGQAAQTAIVNNIIPATSGATSTDCTGYKSFSIQVVSTGTAGTFIFEGSNDNVNFQPVPVFNQAVANPVISVLAITATATQIIYTGSVQCRYLRLRIATTITGGSIQAFTRLSTNSFSQTVQNVSQQTASNLVVNAAITSGTLTTVGTVSAVTAANLSPPSILADVSSAALITTTTTAAVTPTFGISYQVNIPVTVVSGTSPTLDITIEESDNSGVDWYKVYDFQRITGTGIYRSPHLPFFGNRIRYVQTVSGTTPSFTRAINRLQSSYPALPTRQLVDRTISLTTLNSTTPLMLTRDCGNSSQLVINVGAITTTAPAIQLEGSDDFGATWYSIGSPLTAVASSTVQITVNSINAAAVRARVSTAGVGVTAGYVMIKAHD